MRDLVRWDPFRELGDYRRLFEEMEMPQGQWGFDIDVRESPEGYIVEADLPGFNKEDLNITLQEGVLTIEAERKDEEEKREGDNFIMRERYTGRYVRSFRLPTPVKEDQINATFRDGVLRIELSKADEVRPRRIEVRGAPATSGTTGSQVTPNAGGSRNKK
jgi:HSP20 family protein